MTLQKYCMALAIYRYTKLLRQAMKRASLGAMDDKGHLISLSVLLGMYPFCSRVAPKSLFSSKNKRSPLQNLSFMIGNKRSAAQEKVCFCSRN